MTTVQETLSEAQTDRLLKKVFKSLLIERDFESSLEEILSLVEDAFPGCRVNISTINDEGVVRVLKALNPKQHKLHDLRPNPAHSVAPANDRHQALVLNDLDSPHLPREIVPQDDENPVRSGMAVPLLLSEKLNGLLWIYDSKPRLWSPCEVTAIEEIAQALEGLYRHREHQSEKERMRTALLDSEQRMRLVADTIDQVLWVSDPAVESLLFVSPAYATRWGFSTEEACKDPSNFLAPIHDDDRPAVKEGRRAPSADGCTLEYRIRRKQGDERWVREKVFPVYDDAGEISKLVGIIEDVTDQRRAQEQLTEAKLIAEHASEMKSSFLATISHEVRTPLNSVLTASDLLTEKSLGSDERALVEIVKDSGQHLLTLVNDLLDLSKLEAGQMELHVAEFDPVLLAQRVMQLFAHESAQKNVEIKLDSSARDVPRVFSDPRRVEQILINLVGNSLNHTLHGRVTLGVHFDSETSMLECWVQDTGPGLSEEALESLFKPFWNGGTAQTSPRRSGTSGLGLAICKRLLETMEGKLEAYSVENEGSIYRFWIPIHKSAPDKHDPHVDGPSAESKSSDAIAASPVASLKILLAEDNAANQRLARALLERDGHLVTCAANGVEAVEEWRKNDFDLILMDCSMPQLDGFSATRLIRQAGDAKGKVPIIALTAFAMRGDEDRCRAAGMSDYLSKPFDSRMLRKKISEWGQQRREFGADSQSGSGTSQMGSKGARAEKRE